MVWRMQAVMVSTACSLAACATTPKSCRSLPPSIGATNIASIAELRCGADQGVQAAQVALAKRYEAGEGVPRDMKRAIALYELASTAVPPTTAIYSPPVKLGGRGQMLFIDNPNAGPGSAEAQYRLGRLLIEGRGVPQDLKRGRSLIERAAKQGYTPAAVEQSQLEN